MARKPTYEELEQRIKELEEEADKSKQTEDTLRETEERFRSIYEESPVGIEIYDSKGQLLHANKACLDIFGIVDERQIKGFRLFDDPNLPVKEKSKLRKGQMVRFGATFDFDLVKKQNLYDTTKSGIAYVDVVITPLASKGNDGSGEYLVQVQDNTERKQAEEELKRAHSELERRVVARTADLEKAIRSLQAEITERKRSEEALQDSEDMLRSIFRAAPTGIGVVSDRVITQANERLCEILGYSKDELLGQSARMVYLCDEDFEYVGREKYAQIRDKGTGTVETRWQRKDGKVIDVLLSSTPLDLNDLSIGVTFTALDITDRKKAVKALEESEEKYRLLVENANDAIFIIQDGIVKFPNFKTEEMTGYSEKELSEISFINIIHPDDREMVLESRRKRLLGEKPPSTYSFRMINKSGNELIVQINTVLITWEGNPATINFIRDISEQKRLEALLQRAQKMESVGLLAGGVAHDLNNVLSGIVSYPELLLLDLPEDSKLRKPVETMQESGLRAAAIVQDLLTVARGVATTKEPLNLNDLVSDYLNSPEFKKLKQFHPTVTIKSNLNSNLLNITGSHVHIRKVIMNLISNASESIEGSGNVIISTMNRYINRPLRGYDNVTEGEYAVLAVSDDGLGISSGDLERIFDPFYTKKVLGRSGTGLGLAVVWNVVQDHEGYIEVKSNENGTMFELYFSITRDEISDKALSIPIKDYKGNGERILVVDDVESQREISCKMLDTLGYKTKAVSSGEEAVEYLKENTVDLILLDMIMAPGLNGRETYERIIKIHPNQKAIITSGFAETVDVKEAQTLGAGQYIKKPLTLEKIGIAVRDELKK